MKNALALCAALLMTVSAVAENHTEQSPITMEQLLRELRVQGGNWIFNFDRPVFAKVVLTVSSFPDGKKSEVTEFVSDRADSQVTLFFMASGMWVGDYPKPNQVNDKEMKVKLSNCAETDGTRIIHYVDKFAQQPWIMDRGQQGLYSPCLPVVPELNKEYALHYYYKEGDPYEAKATICFLERLEDAANVRMFVRGEPRRWKSAGDKD